MKKMITITLILCLAAGALLASHRNLLSSSFSPQTSNERNRAWKLFDKITDGWSNGTWVPSEHAFYHYNATYPARVDSIVTEAWNPDAGVWQPYSNLIFTYLPDQEYIGFAEASMNIGSYIPFIRFYATYDNQHRLTSYRVSMFQMGLGFWSDMTRMQIVYGAGTTFQAYQWDSEDFENPASFSHGTFEYDGSGRITTETWQTSPDSVNWVNDYQTTRSYHPHDTSTGASFISGVAHQMMLSGLDNNNNLFGMATEEIEKDWNETVWANSYKSIYTYNTNDKLTEILYQNWNADTWTDESRDTYTYDTNGNLQQLINQSHPDTEWLNDTRYTYNWTQVTANDDDTVPAASVLALNVYPNPFRTALTISAKSASNADVTYTIYNLKGQIVRSLNAAKNVSISWDGMDKAGKAQGAGIYFVKAQQGNTSTTQKLLKLN